MSSQADADQFTQWRARVEGVLDEQLTSNPESSERLLSAMRYSCLDGGKRLRAIMVYACCDSVGGESAMADRCAAAVEMVHAYSLIHDDLPAMDDDDLRRGRPSCHRAFDEATAILAGDALQSRAFEIIATDASIDSGLRCRMLAALAAAIGPRGMASGQALDMVGDAVAGDATSLETMHRQKTGALIGASAELGLLAGAVIDHDRHVNIRQFARSVGLAFQITDDILDEKADPGLLGKTKGKDQAAGKSTYVTLLGLNSSIQSAKSMRDKALASLDGMGDNAKHLVRIANFAVDREF